LVAGFLLIFLGSWMVGQITQFAQSLFLSIPSLVN
jgi:flagellar biosynthesis protein FliQ